MVQRIRITYESAEGVIKDAPVIGAAIAASTCRVILNP